MKRADIRLVLPPWWDELTDTAGNEAGSSSMKCMRGSDGSDNKPMMSILVNKPQSMLSNESHSEAPTATIVYNRNDGMNIIKNNPNRNTYVTTRYEPAALQLHQVLPTLQSTEDYYRTTATSPFQNSMSDGTHNMQTTPTNQNELTVPGGMTLVSASPISDDAIRRHSSNRQFEDYESDDELRREHISFPMDGGK